MSGLIFYIFAVSKVFTIRVFADEKPTEITIASTEGTYKIQASGDMLFVNGSKTPYFQQMEAQSYTIIAGGKTRSYAGGFTFYSFDGEMYILNYIPEEAYIASVVASEIPGAQPEARKAQAILARTYVYKNVGRHGQYDLCDGQHCQVYRGLPVDASSLSAAQGTAGLVLGYKGTIADIYYHSTCGGMTLLPSDVWPGMKDQPYHQRVKDTLCRISPYYEWDDTFNLDPLFINLGFGQMPSSVKVVRDKDWSPVKGFVFFAPDSVYFDYSRVSDAIDHHPMTRIFDAEIKETLLILHAHGYGHAVGMCQVGAMALAKSGANYRDILTFYFPGTEILSLASF